MSEEISGPLGDMLWAFNDDGIEAALEYIDPEIEWWAPPEWLEDRLYRGHDDLRRLASFWTEQFDEYRLVLERSVDLGDDRVLALLHQEGVIKGSGDRVELAVGWIVQSRRGVLTRVEVYFSWDDAYEAAGVPKE